MKITYYLKWPGGLVFLALISLLFVSCASTRKASTLEKMPDCSCSLEGFFETMIHFSQRETMK